MTSTTIRLSLIATVIILGFALALANSSGAPDGVTGAPSESNCAQSGCHDMQPAMTAYRTFDVTAGDAIGYVFPGETTLVSVGFSSDAGGSRWGFELTALDESGQPIGTMITDSIFTQTSLAGNGRQYAKQTDSGTGRYTWTVGWVLPPSPAVGYITFYASGCEADGDGLASGDKVFIENTRVIPFYDDCRIPRTGDVNYNGFVSSSDIIWLVSYIFKGGAEPKYCPAVGDIDCDGAVTSADILKMVNYVFKRGGFPCDVCTIIPEKWLCP